MVEQNDVLIKKIEKGNRQGGCRGVGSEILVHTRVRYSIRPFGNPK